MPIKLDASGRRWVEMEFLLPATPEQVWHAMATGPGNAAWFTTAEIEERIGGRITFHFMPGVTSGGTVTCWEPPHRFGYVETGWAEDAPPVVTDVTIFARSGDECLVRMTHSLISPSSEWDSQMEGFEAGWPGFIDVLHLYLAHHAGAPAASFQLAAQTTDGALVAWRKLLDGLGHETADVGENWTVDAGETLFGEVVRVRQDETQRYVLLRIVEAEQADARAAETAAQSEARWQAWLDGIAGA